MSSIETTDLAKQLVGWYRSGHRDLPWRNTENPYHIWLSEIMLQQTQVATVIPYYERFLEAFPTVHALAEAPIDQVLKLWEGLGYYSRARNLHKAAQVVSSEYQGVFPKTLAEVLALPGIGQYTAGAILTFAFKQPTPILDGNVKRVLVRLYAIDKPLQETKVIQALWQYSEALLPSDGQDAYDFNQALMELGATVCTPKDPSCETCPWVQGCQAYAQDKQYQLPVKKPAKATPHYTIAVGVVWKGDKCLIALRPEEGLLGGLWEFPGGKCEPDESLKACVQRELKEETGLNVEVGALITTVKHAYSHFKITLHAFACEYVSGRARPKASQKLKWVLMEDLDSYAFPKANKKVLEAIKQSPGRQLTLC